MGHKATPHADGTGRRHAVYEATLRSVGNPDFGQYSPVSPRRKVRAGSLRDVLVAAAEYIGEWDLGGGNWTQPTVYEVRGNRRRTVGYISYNLRLWKGRKRFPDCLTATDITPEDAREAALARRFE